MPKKKRGRKKTTPKITKKTAVKETITKFYDKSSVYTTQFVRDFNKAKKFYAEKLEFPINLEIPEAGWMELKLPVKGAFLGLSLHRKDQGEFVTANSLNISIKDIEKTKSLLDSRGIKTSEIVDMPDMISMITIADPDENKIHFIAPPRIKSKK
jgi:predicted enzyme related to lactoylglutathione lyase